MQIMFIESATIRYTLEKVTGCPIFLICFSGYNGRSAGSPSSGDLHRGQTS